MGAIWLNSFRASFAPPCRRAPVRHFAVMPSGVVKKWMDEKGFGFISPDDGGDDVFVHRSALSDVDYLEEGDTVKYQVEYDDRKGKYKASECSKSRGGGGGGGGGGKSKGGKGDRYAPW